MKNLFVLALCLTTFAPVWAATPQERAVSALESAIKSDPDNDELWAHLGFAYRKIEQFDKAIDAFEKAVKLDPKSQESLYMLGLLYEKKKRNADALRAWKAYLPLAKDLDRKSMAENHIHQLSQ